MDPFIDEDQLSAILNKDVTEDDFDLAPIVLAAACDAVRTYTGQTLTYVADDTITLEAPISNRLLLPQVPVRSVSAVSVQVSGYDAQSLTETTDYTLLASGILIRAWPYLWRSERAARATVTLTYDHGYLPQGSGESSDDLPADVQLAALQIAARMYSSRQMSSSGVQSESIGNYSVTYGTGTSISQVSDEERKLLDPYRLARVV